MTKTKRLPLVATLLGMGLVVAAACGGCTSTEPPATAADQYTFDRSELTQPDVVSMERVTGARGEHLGWVRTERAGDDGGTYQVYLDQDMQSAGYQTFAGQHYRPSDGELESTGTYSRARGLGETFGRRAEDIVVTPVSQHELAASGPLSPRSTAVALGDTADEADEDMDADVDDE